MIAKFINHLQKAERGQSIIILAFAFIVLLGFVGLTTDVSLMFVRYATIRRAVDSASIAAATQMRQGTEEAAVAIAARQFVEFHGLDSVKVLVDTCLSLNRTAPDKTQEQLELEEELCTDDQRKLVKVTVQADSPTVFLRLLGWDRFTLQASAISETAALDVVLVMDVSESMLSETTYDDWARIGMGYAYKPPSITKIAKDKRDAGKTTLTDAQYWEQAVLSASQADVNARLWYDDGIVIAPDATSTAPDFDYRVRVLDLDASAKFDPEYGFPGDVSQFQPRVECRARFWPYSPEATGTTGFPGYVRRDSGGAQDNPALNLPDIVNLKQMVGSTDYGLYNLSAFNAGWTSTDNPSSGTKYNGFVPSYNFYGCCNDPGIGGMDDERNVVITDPTTGDFDFTDLICQPFKGARDAVELFLERIDFIRGDRVAFVTFDRSAFLINPWNQAGSDGGGSHMIDRYDIALDTLRRVIGVRAEPNFYVWSNNPSQGTPNPTAGWVSFSGGIAKDASGITSSVPINYSQADGSGSYFGEGPDGSATFGATSLINFNYPVNGNCAFHNATLPSPYGITTLGGGQPSLAKVALPYPADTSFNWNNHPLGYHSGLGRQINFPDIAGNGGSTRYSYDLWASCRGTNIGAALREGNNALLDPQTTRRFGAIWVMVLLSDGAAGASDPVRRTFDTNVGGEKLDETQPYIVNTGVYTPVAGQYGAFGVCPYGTPNGTTPGPGEVVDVQAENEGAGFSFPYCSDELPDTRHNCDFRPLNGAEAIRDADYVSHDDWLNGAASGPTTAGAEVEWNSLRGNLYDVDIGTTDCTLYDVDDYARDWADYIGLQEDENSNELLPTIYTIGFGLTFGNNPSPDPANYTGDYLGEQMLRYIADVGDNNRLDNDYYQYYFEGDGVGGLAPGEEYGTRGACQDQTAGPNGNTYDLDGNGTLTGTEIADMYLPLAPRVNCGNYFNAPTADELELVFDSIASKLFTRLAG